MRVKLAIFVFLAGMTANAAFAGGASRPVTLAETPVAVQKKIQAQAGDGKVGEIDKIQSGGQVIYDVGLTARDGQERDFSVDEDGTLLSVEVTLAETPAAAQKSIRTLMGQGKLESIDKNLGDPEVAYDVELTGKDGQEKDFTIAADGTLLSAEVALNETPEAVQKAIQNRMGGGKLESIDKNYGDDGVSYDVEVTSEGGQEKGFTVAANGSLVSAQVTLEETPRPVRKTIKEQIGDGKILRIDRSFEKQDGVFPYEVEGRKDGKSFNFIVGPRGKFLGMDD